MTTLLIGPRDPILLRDARSFDPQPGARAFTLPWPLPRTVAGAMRTYIGNHATPQPFQWPEDGERALGIAVHGPLLAGRESSDAEWTLYVAAPRDFVALKPAGEGEPATFMSLEPWANLPTGAGALWNPEDQELQPLTVTKDGKADSEAPAFWPLDLAWRWLTDPGRASNPTFTQPPKGLSALKKDIRTHISIMADTGTAEEGKLFGVEGLVFTDAPIPKMDGALSAALGAGTPEVRIVANVTTDTGWKEPDATWIPLGGERRMTGVHQETALWPAPPSFPENFAWDRVQGIRLMLATPAIFKRGWKPGWLADSGLPHGFAIEGIEGVKLSLAAAAAAIDRPIPVSGWDLATRTGMPTRFAVRAGSVYFLKVTPQERTEDVAKQLLHQLWLKPISDDDQHRNDGYGLVLPGIW